MDSHLRTEAEGPAPEPTSVRPFRVPELLAPAGDWDCARAAVENGADAIYFGLEKFNARMRAHNFTEADLPALVEFLHLRGVRGYVTVNTLVFEDELADAERYLRTIIASGIDAVIVQDVGICRLIRQLSPDFPIHASTQMTITSATGVEFARDLGCHLVVLARECSITEIDKIGQAVSAPGVPLEVFVHGALCVAYSGQCLTSEALGGRSANRGECAQACRMPYELISDGEDVPLGDRRYLLSPQDLSGLGLLPELAAAGVASLKIEGRLKAPEYVANITRIYRGALDRLRPDEGRLPEDPQERYELEMAFSRGLHTGWLGGIDNQELVHGRFGKKRGVYLGQVARVLRDSVVVDLGSPLKPGDGVVFDAGHPDEEEEGGRVYEIWSRNADRTDGRTRHDSERVPSAEEDGRFELTFGRGHMDFSRIQVGDKLWKTSDPELEKRWRQSYETQSPRYRRPISFEVHGHIGASLTVIARDGTGHIARAASSMPLVQAEKQPLTTERLRNQLGRLGGSPFEMDELHDAVEGEVMLPVSELNRLRREVVAELEHRRSQPIRWQLRDRSASDEGRTTLARAAESTSEEAAPGGKASVGTASAEQSPSEQYSSESASATSSLGTPPISSGPVPGELIVLVRSLPQLEAALEAGVTTIYCDFENPKQYRQAVPMFRDAIPDTDSRPTGAASRRTGGPNRAAVFVAPPRVFKMGEEWTLKQVRSSEPDGYLVRNYDHLRYFAQDRMVGDFSLNVANHLSAEYFRSRFGLERVTASYDLNFQQLEALLVGAPPEWFEITVHQHMPMFHMEHCVYCAFLSDGKDYRDCGRPCDDHDVRLRDRVGAEHPLKADAGCRNTVFNSQAQTGAEYVARMRELGVRNFRIEFLNDSPAEVGRTIARYRQLLRGEISGSELWREMKLRNQLGVTRGQMAGR